MRESPETKIENNTSGSHLTLERLGFMRVWNAIVTNIGTLWSAGMVFSLFCIPLLLSVRALRQFWQYPGMVLLSLVIFILFCIPVGISFTAMHDVVIRAYLGEQNSLGKSLKTVIKGSLSQTVRMSILFGVLMLLLCAIGIGVWNSGGENSFTVLCILALQMVLALACLNYCCLQIVFVELSLGTILKNSLLLSLGYLRRSFFSAFWILLPAAIMIWLFPIISALLAVVCLPVFAVCFADCCAWPVMDQVFGIEKQLDERS